MTKILLVEDNAMNSELVKEILEMNNYQIKCTKTGLEALEVLESESFDLMLTDINLPKMNGIELVKQLKDSSNRPKKIIALTSDCKTKTGESFEEIGFDGFVRKPFKINEFREYVKSFIDRP